MASGIWTAAAGASAQAHNLDVIANNLANTDTTAFKKDMPTFKEYLSTVEREQGALDIPRGPIKDKEFYPLDGRDQSYVILDGTHISHRQGNLKVTQNPLDVALEGPGFMEVDTPQGVRYTRNGILKISSDGTLVNLEGHPILGGILQGGEARTLAGQNNDIPPAARHINLRDRGSALNITPTGNVYAGDTLVARINVIEFQDLKQIKKQGSQLFENLDPTNNRSIVATETRVLQGVIEGSNVNPIEEMTQMIKANRLFEQDLKALKTYGELMGKEVNEVGKL